MNFLQTVAAGVLTAVLVGVLSFYVDLGSILPRATPDTSPAVTSEPNEAQPLSGKPQHAETKPQGPSTPPQDALTGESTCSDEGRYCDAAFSEPDAKEAMQGRTLCKGTKDNIGNKYTLTAMCWSPSLATWRPCVVDDNLAAPVNHGGKLYCREVVAEGTP